MGGEIKALKGPKLLYQRIKPLLTLRVKNEVKAEFRGPERARSYTTIFGPLKHVKHAELHNGVLELRNDVWNYTKMRG